MIKPKVSMKTKNDNSKKIKEVYDSLKGSYVTVGIHSDAGQYPDGTEVTIVALANEFGVPSKGIPQRSYFRSALEEHATLINAWRDEVLENMVLHGWSVLKALTTLGFRVQVLIQNKIKSNVPPPNAPSTLKAKQRAGVAPKGGMAVGRESSGTLRNTNLMLRSVGFTVYVKGRRVGGARNFGGAA